jgi:fructose-specific phosphotransferase system IIC component
VLAVLGRPHDQEWLLLFHLIGAFALIGGFIAVSTASLAALTPSPAERVLALRRVALVTNLVVVLPGFVTAYVFGTILADRRYPNTPSWLDVAFPLTDVAVVFGFVVLTLLQWWTVRRTRAGTLGGFPAAAASVLPPLVLGLLIAILFLMTAKP